MRKYTLLIFVFINCLLSGCVSYITRYDTYLLNSDPPKTLHFSDDKFEFNFIPVPNGVYFKINNLNSKPAFLEWDRCYFIEPNGNSSKSLNTDLIEENTETMEKAKYESILPPQGSFSRFTTSAKNITVFKNVSINVKEIDHYFFNFQLIVRLKDISSIVSEKKFFEIGRYWPEYEGPGNKTMIYLQPPKDSNLIKITEYIKYNDNMGLGLGIKLNDTILDYRFDFHINKVTIFKIIPMVDGKDSAVIIKTASELDDWKWK
jgi:hypothetical protein